MEKYSYQPRHCVDKQRSMSKCVFKKLEKIGYNGIKEKNNQKQSCKIFSLVIEASNTLIFLFILKKYLHCLCS